MEQKVDFFIVGSQKAGTTALYDILRRQKGVQMSAVKEVHHFDDEEAVDWSRPEHLRLHRHFDWNVQGVVRGEATPVYVFWPGSLQRIRSYNTDAKLIVGLRHPAYRAHSQWTMNVSRGEETLSFSDAIGPKGSARMRDGSHSAMRLYSYIERGLYARQVSHALELFPRRQVLFYRTDSLWDDPSGTLNGIGSFLGFEPTAEIPSTYISPYEKRNAEALGTREREFLDRIFMDDLLETQKLTGMDLSDWRKPDYTETIRSSPHR